MIFTGTGTSPNLFMAISEGVLTQRQPAFHKHHSKGLSERCKHTTGSTCGAGSVHYKASPPDPTHPPPPSLPPSLTTALSSQLMQEWCHYCTTTRPSLQHISPMANIRNYSMNGRHQMSHLLQSTRNCNACQMDLLGNKQVQGLWRLGEAHTGFG